MSYGARPEDWLNFDIGLGLGEYLLPVVSNPHAPVSPRSALKQLGKVPSLYNSARHVVGIPNWTQHKATSAELNRWGSEPDYGICARMALLRAVDGDITDPILAKEIENVILAYAPGAPVRRRANSSKFLVPFIIQGGPYPKRVLKTRSGIIEFLADSQQAVLCGTHSSGARYEGLENVDSFPELSINKFNVLWQILTDAFAVEEPSESSLRNPPSAEGVAAMDDATATYLYEAGHVTGTGKENQLFIQCPFSDEHSDPGAPDGTSTAYLPAGNRGYQQGHFSCLHAHCANRSDEEFLDAYGIRAADFDIIQLTPEEENVSKAKTTNRFKLYRYSDFANREPPGYIIKDVLPRAEFGIMYGASTAGKSFVALDMAFAIARASLWNGRETTKGRVVYIAAEGAGSFSKRIKAYMLENNISGELPFDIIADSPNFFLKDDALELAKAIGKADVIFDDTLAQTSVGANENSAEDVAKILYNIKGIHRATGALVMPLHHEGKDENKGARGSTSLRAGADVEIRISRVGADRAIEVTKQKDGEDGLRFGFTLKTVQIDMDNSSCVVEYVPLQNRAAVRFRKMRVWQIKTFEALDHFGDNNKPALQEEIMKHMLANCIARDLGTDEKGKLRPDRRRDEIVREFKTLIAAGEIAIRNGIVSRPLESGE